MMRSGEDTRDPRDVWVWSVDGVPVARGQGSKGSDDHRGGNWGVASHSLGQAGAELDSGRGSCNQGGSRNNNWRHRRLLNY